MSDQKRSYSSLDPGRRTISGEFSFVPYNEEALYQQEQQAQQSYNGNGDANGNLQDKSHRIDIQNQYAGGQRVEQSRMNQRNYYGNQQQVYQQYEEEEDSYERQKQEIINEFQNQELSQQDSEQTSIYTLSDSPTDAQLNQEETIYDLPTHISSHHDVLRDGAITQPSTPVSGVFVSTERLRPLSQTNLATQIAEDELREPMSSAVSRDVIASDGEDWDERGAAKIVQKKKNIETGEEEEFIIRRSVRDFKFGKDIGFGSYSTVVLATDKNTGKNFAVKVLDKRHIIKEKKVKYVNIEKNTLNRLGARSGIIRLFFTFQDESCLYFVLDYAANGELLNLIKQYGSLTEETTRYYAAQILDAIKYMHDNGVIHRDLKPENILLDDQMRIQITDFGTAKLLEKNPDTGVYPMDTRAKSFVGTAEYVSPELLNEKAIGKACDVWAFGCIVYQMIAGKPPFKATNDYMTFQKIVKLQYAFTAGFPMVVRDLIKRILVLNPANRYTVKHCMKHLFFQGIDFLDHEQVWGSEPPEIKGPYKISAKSMLPVPELSNNAMPKTRITVPRKVTPIAPKRNPVEKPVVSAFPPTSPQVPPSNKPFTASQQVLQKAREKVAARKAQLEEERVLQVQDQQQNTVKATSAASVALHKQPADIIKQVNEHKELKKSGETHNHNELSVPVKEVSTITASTTKNKTASSSQPSTASNVSTPPMSSMDIKYSHHIRLSSGERVLHDGKVTLYQTTVDVLGKKYKGKLKDITTTAGGNTLLSQVAKGSYRGLRNMDRQGEEVEKSIIAEYDTAEYGGISINDDEFFRESKSFKIKKFFSTSGSGSGSGSGSEEGEGPRDRVLVVTNQGRLLFLQKFKNDKDETSLALRVEIYMHHPMIRVREFISSIENLSPSQNSMKGFFVVEAYHRAFVVECYKSDVTKWCRVISESKSLSEERNSPKPSTQVSSVTGLGIDTINSSSGTPTRKPSVGNTRSVAQTSSIKRSVTQPVIKSPKVHQGTVKSPVVSQQISVNAHYHSNGHGHGDAHAYPPVQTPTQVPALAPSKPRLFHGLPLPESTKSPRSSETSAAAVTQANMLTNAAKLAIASHPQSAANHGATPGQINTGHSEKRPQVTGMNSRMLARSHNQRKR